MDAIFLKIVNMSISACWIVLAIILLRIVLKKAPKWVNCVLWGIAGLRLVMPFSFESVFSLIPSAEFVPQELIHSNSSVNVSGTEIFNYIGNNPVSYDLGISNGSLVFTEINAPDGNYINPLLIITFIASIVWLIGIAALLIYTIVSFIRLKSKIGTAILLRDNIYQSDAVVSPFVLGIIKPKIYLPFNMNGQDTDHVIAHEQAHIKRKDHLWKPLGFLILTLHWFNPMVWLGYILLCRDIELACDEKVVKDFNNEQKADYSQALLTCSVNRRMIAACPLAFGEVGVRDRIKSVLNYKKPAFWIIIVAVVASITVAVCFLTNPVNSQINSKVYKAQLYYHDEVIGADRANDEDTGRRYHISEAFVLSMYYDDGMNYQINHQGILIKQKNYNPEITSLILDKLPSQYNQDKIKEVYFAKDNNQLTTPKDLYVLLKFTNGDLIMSYLPYGSNGYYAMEVLKIKPLASKTQLHSLSHITGTKGSTDCEGVTVKIIEALYFAENPYIKVQWENNTGKDFLYGEMFRLYKYKNEIKTPVDITIDNLAWHSIGYISKSKTDEKVFSLKYFDLSEPGIYTLEFDFNIGDDTETDYTAVLEFEIADTPATIEPVSTSDPAITPDTPIINTPGDADSMLDVAFESTLSYAGIPQKSNQIFYRSLNREKLSDSNVRHLPIHRLDTYEDLTNFKNTFSGDLTFDNGYDEIPSFNTATTKYDKEFFEDNSLIVVFIDSTNSTHRYAMQSVEHNGVFCVQIEETTKAEAVDDVLSGWFLTVTASDELLDGCTEFDAYINDKTDSYDGSKIPQLMVSCNGIWAEAVMGTTEWTFDNGNGTMQTINGDSAAHPTDRLDYLLPKALKVKRTDGELTAVTLNFDKKPDSIKVNSLFITENGDIKPFDTEKKGFDIFLNSSKETCIYEVVAIWNSSDKYYGTVRYSFCVVEKAEENTPETTTAVIVDASGNLNPYFNAKVLEVKENNILVEPLEGEAERNSASQIYVSTDVISTIPVPDLKKGDTVRIIYNGEIQETFPAQISKVFAIYEQ